MTIHRDLIEPAAIHPASFVGSTDPALDVDNHVEADKLWIDTTTGPPYTLKKRDSGNTAWEVVGVAGDAVFTAGDITNVPAGGIAATDVQAAIDELDSEKVDTSLTVSAGAGLTGGGDLSTNRTLALDINGQTALSPADNTADLLIIWDASASAFKKVIPDDLGISAGSTVIVEEIDGSPTGSFDTIKFTNGTVTDNGDGSVTVISGGGGGSTVYAAGSSTPNTENPHNTNVNGNAMDSMSITVSPAGSTDYLFTAYVRYKKSGNMFLYLMDGATFLGAQKIGGTIPWGNYTTNIADGDVREQNVSMIITLAAGSHTIVLNHNAASNTNSITFYERTMSLVAYT